jgi:hypothetical protein
MMILNNVLILIFVLQVKKWQLKQCRNQELQITKLSKMKLVF